MRKCEKDDSPHWSRFFTIISFMIVALLIAAIGVWIAGLVQLRSKPNSSNPGEIWGMLGLFFAMVFLFIAGWSLTVSVHFRDYSLNYATRRYLFSNKL